MVLALFFTNGMSLEAWLNTGLFDREKLIYEEHLKGGHVEAVFWFTYGSRDAEIARKLRAEKRLHPGISVIAMPTLFKGKIGKLIYSFLMPVFQKRFLKWADIYKTNQMDGSWSAVLAKWLYHKPLIVRTGYTLSLFARGLEKPKPRIFMYQLMERLAYKYTDCAIVTSKKDKKYISEKYGHPQKNIVVIPNYIDTDLFKPDPESPKFDDRIIFIGRLNKQKNLFNLITAVSRIRLALDIYGKGELREALAGHAKRLNAHVNFMGTVPNREIPEILNRYWYYILPSYNEGNPKTLLEAMACGSAVIGANVEGIKEIIRHGENGLLCEIHSYSINKAINTLMRDKNLCDRLGQNARRSIVENCALDKIVDKEQEIIEKLRD